MSPTMHPRLNHPSANGRSRRHAVPPLPPPRASPPHHISDQATYKKLRKRAPTHADIRPGVSCVGLRAKLVRVREDVFADAIVDMKLASKS